MTSKVFALPMMLLREALSPPRLQRRPEPAAEMDDPTNIQAFHEQGSPSGPLLPIYHFNALATSRLIAEGGTLLDLGSGSGQYLAYLGQRRPDIRIVGLDIAPGMVTRGKAFLEASGLSPRVELRLGDMTQCESVAPEHVDVVSSVFSLHHLPAAADLDRCLAAIAALRAKHKCSVWLFDHARPRHPRTPEVFPEIFTPEAPAAFRTDSKNSLMASWSVDELSDSLGRAGLGQATHACARFMRLYQAHWVASGARAADGHRKWIDVDLPHQAAKDFHGLQHLFPGIKPGA